ncbi:MAG: bifunctional 4-hydroxy-3-methylbut-2-enyl diphosphate reductase/30S ribosomal protein S1 [Oscillospiraceae bacterium]|nr:bifunctional 4-hydroxy-3-methylbut-2-enyl diphosphate reductase/30S ribosomal protein S1 [Oscillospiraceae bacterium]
MKKLFVAKSAGFCFGVDRAVRIALQQAPCYTLGPLIHNRFAIHTLQSSGIEVIESLDNLPAGARVVIRSHGAGESVYRELNARGIHYIDATCPYVKKIHSFILKESEAGRQAMLLGDKNHPEVIAATDWCVSCLVFSSEEDLETLFSTGVIWESTPLAIAAQTTSNQLVWGNIINFLKKVCTNVKKLDTICKATSIRQRDASLLSRKVEAMVVVGDPHSANTKSLTECCSCPVFLVECAKNLDLGKLSGFQQIGLTAGASAPSTIIEEVIYTMTENMNLERTDFTPDTDKTFEEMLDQSCKTLYTGEIVTGMVSSVSPTEVGVDLGIKQAAYIPLSELTDDPGAKPEDFVKIGDEIETYVVRVNDADGMVTLSKRRLDTVKSWERVETARETGAVLEGKVADENKGGIIVSIHGVRVFVPSSQSGVPRETPLSSIIGQTVRLKITEFDRRRRRVVGSIRSVLTEERRADSQKAWDTVEAGQKITGTVKSIAPYGVFVDIGGVDGLVHITEMSWDRSKAVTELAAVGGSLEVYVIGVDKENHRISLSHRRTLRNPWDEFIAKYSAGDEAEVRIVKLMPFGAFAQLLPGVDGLIHISQISDRRIDKPSDELKEGQTVTVKITEINTVRKKISLSIRALLESEIKEQPDAEQDEIVATAGPPEAVEIPVEPKETEAKSAPEPTPETEATADSMPESEAKAEPVPEHEAEKEAPPETPAELAPEKKPAARRTRAKKAPAESVEETVAQADTPPKPKRTRVKKAEPVPGAAVEAEEKPKRGRPKKTAPKPDQDS